MGNRPSSSAAKAQAALAAQRERQSRGVLNLLSGDLSAQLSGTPISVDVLDPNAQQTGQSITFGGQGDPFRIGNIRQNVSDQFDLSRDNILSNIAPGGSLEAALADLERDRARATVGGLADLNKENRILASSFGSQGAGQALAGLGSASQNLQAINAAQFQQDVDLGKAIFGIGQKAAGAAGGAATGSGGIVQFLKLFGGIT